MAKNKQPGHLFKPEAVLLLAALDNVLDVDAPVSQLAFVRDFVAVGDEVTVYVAHMGQARHHAGAIGIAQAPFYPVALIFFLGDDIISLILFAQLPNGGAARRLVIQPFHLSSPFWFLSYNR